MKRIRIVVFFIVAALTANFHRVEGATFYSIANGTMSTTNNWSYTQNGPSCGVAPTPSDVIHISHYIAMTYDLTNPISGSPKNGIVDSLIINAGGTLDGGTTYSLDIRSTGVLIVCGTLIVKDQTFSNGSYISVCPTGVLTINGNFDNKNNSGDVYVSGKMTVKGAFTNGTGSVITITDPGVLIVPNGPYSNIGTITCNGFTSNCPSEPCTISCGNSLPIELLSFDAKPDKETVKVNWTTASQVNNDFFTIERSNDGERYQEINRVEGAGNSSESLSYSLVDPNPYAGVSYYRLKQTDYDGRTAVYPPVAVEVKKILIYPNPVINDLDFLLYSNSNTVAFEIYDATGRKVFSNERPLEKGQNTLKINFSSFAKGLYTLRVETAEGVTFEKFVK